jgi:tight adherence protein B
MALLLDWGRGSLPHWLVLEAQQAFQQVSQEGMPEALDLMVSALRAGHSLIAAMGLVARECADPSASNSRLFRGAELRP